MERLWSPWRLAYVTATARAENGCIFCEVGDDLVLIRGRFSYAILNLYPYNNGHLMVVPNRHTPSLGSLTTEELHEMAELMQLSERVLVEAYQPQGINVGVNLGKPAGAGVLEHVHVHLVPRWSGDTNFMTVVGTTRVLPEDLPQSAARLKPIFERLGMLGRG